MERHDHSHTVDVETAFDFLNTTELEDGFLVDHFVAVDDAFRWLSEREIVHAADAEAASKRLGSDPRASARALGRVRRVRDALREVADAVVHSRPAPDAALAVVNEALGRRMTVQLARTADGIAVGHRHTGDPLDDALARLADPIVEQLAAGHHDRLRVCDSDSCRWIFFDASRTGRRRWCDMSTCGNRAKAARHRARARTVQAGDVAAT